MADSSDSELEGMVLEYRSDFIEGITESGLRIADSMGVLFVGHEQAGVAVFDREALEECFKEAIERCQSDEHAAMVDLLSRAKEQALDFWSEPAAGLLRIMVIELNTGQILSMRMGLHECAQA